MFYYGKATCTCGNIYELVDPYLRRLILECSCGVPIDLFLDIPEYKVEDAEVRELIGNLRDLGY
jgi:hypothetical protein